MSTARPHNLYDEDFFAWTQLQARELRRFARTRPNLPLDLEHISEEIADLGTERRNAIRSFIRRTIEHLLLLQHSPAPEPRAHWVGEVVNFRQEIADRITPVLRRDLRRRLPKLYQEARSGLATKLVAHHEVEAAAALPETCPYTLDQVLGDFWPDPRAAGDQLPGSAPGT
jgi:hypothetical protein